MLKWFKLERKIVLFLISDNRLDAGTRVGSDWVRLRLDKIVLLSQVFYFQFNVGVYAYV